MTTLEFRDRLARRSRRAKAPVTLPLLGPLEVYFRLLTQWNAKINLTALPLDPPTDQTFDRLLVEPLGAAKHVVGAALDWIDLGSGGGSPAIPMKIARPDLRLRMVESKERKSAFLREVVRTLGLSESVVVTERFETLIGRDDFKRSADLVTVRAVKTDDELFSTAGSLLRTNGRLFLFRPSHDSHPVPPGFRFVATTHLLDEPPSFLSVFARVFHVEQGG